MSQKLSDNGALVESTLEGRTAAQRATHLANMWASLTAPQLAAIIAAMSAVDLVTAQVLANKSIDWASNTITMTKAAMNTAVSDGDVVFLDSTDTISGAKTFSGTVDITDVNFRLLGDGDSTKRGKFDVALLATGTTRALQFPPEAGVIVTQDGTQILTNKSIVASQLTGALPAAQMPALTGAITTVAGALATLLGSFTKAQLNTAVSNGDVSFLDSNDTITGDKSYTGNVTVVDGNFFINDNADATKVMKFQIGGFTTGQTRTITVPDASDTLINLASTQSLTNKTLDNTNTVTLKDILFTLQDDGDATKQAQFQLSGITAGQTRTFTLPDLSSTLANLGSSTQSFTGSLNCSGTSIQWGNSANASTIQLGNGATTNGTTKAVNIGTSGVSGSITNVTLGSSVAGATGTIVNNFAPQDPTTTVANLPTATAGRRQFVSDANTTIILGLGLVVVGGGANFTPVYADGTNWKIG